MAENKEYIVQSQRPPIEYDIPDINEIRRRLDRIEQDRKLFVDSSSGEALTCDQVKSHVESVASYLKQQGVHNGEHVVVYASNCVQYPEMVLGCWLAGGIPVCVNSLLTADDLAHIIKLTGSKLVFTTSDTAEKAVAAVNAQKIVIVTVLEHPGCVSWDDVLESSKTDTERLSVDPEDTAAILFSSGTTGFPKAVKLPYRSLGYLCTITSHKDYANVPKTTVIFQPMSHIYGLALALMPLWSDTSCMIMPRFNLGEYLRLIVQYQVTVLMLVPPLVAVFLRYAKREHLAGLKNVVCSAAPLAPELEKKFNDFLPDGLKINQAYGLTEAGGPITLHLLSDKDAPPSNMGQVAPNMTVKIVDQTSGKSLPANEHGEICAKGPVIMTGYLNNPEATAESIDPDGWLHTGDIGYYDENGYFFVVDRAKEMIKYKGHQVAPAQLEDVLLSHPDVMDAAVVGIPDEDAGELPAAWVVKKPAATATEEQIIEFVKDKVAPYKKIRGGLHFVENIPKSSSGKILRRQVREALAKLTISK